MSYLTLYKNLYFRRQVTVPQTSLAQPSSTAAEYSFPSSRDHHLAVSDSMRPPSQGLQHGLKPAEPLDCRYSFQESWTLLPSTLGAFAEVLPRRAFSTFSTIGSNSPPCEREGWGIGQGPWTDRRHKDRQDEPFGQCLLPCGSVLLPRTVGT